MRLHGRVAIVTGAGSGIGRAIALAFAREGCRIMIADLNEEAGKGVVKEIEALGHQAFVVKTDVTTSAQVLAMVEATVKAFGTVEILVNNAGIQHVAPILELEEAKWNQLLAIHLTGAFLCTKAVLPHMIAQRWGRIINISSVHGKMASKFKAPYVSAKHGLLGLTRVAALEVAEYGITANAICPGYVRTPLVERQIPDQAKAHHMTEAEVVEKVLLKDVPQKRFIEPEEVAAMAVYLCTEAAQGVTGESIVLSGGWVMD